MESGGQLSAVIDSLMDQIKADVETVATGLARVELGEWTPNQLGTLPAACVAFDGIDEDDIDTTYQNFVNVNVSVVVFADKQPGKTGYEVTKAYHRDVCKALFSSTYLTHGNNCYHTGPAEFEHLDAEGALITGFVQAARCLTSWQWDDPDSA